MADPITLSLALGGISAISGLAGSAGSLFGGDKPAAPSAPAQAPPVQSPTGGGAAPTSGAGPSFLAAAAAPAAGQLGQKSLLGA